MIELNNDDLNLLGYYVNHLFSKSDRWRHMQTVHTEYTPWK